MGFPVQAKMLSFSRVFENGTILMGVRSENGKDHSYYLDYAQLQVMRSAVERAFADLDSTQKTNVANV